MLSLTFFILARFIWFFESAGELHLGPASELQNMRRLAQCLNDMTVHNIKSNTVSSSPAEGLEVCEGRPSLLRLTELGGRAPPHAGARIHRDTGEIPTAEVVLKTRYPSRT